MGRGFAVGPAPPPPFLDPFELGAEFGYVPLTLSPPPPCGLLPTEWTPLGWWWLVDAEAEPDLTRFFGFGGRAGGRVLDEPAPAPAPAPAPEAAVDWCEEWGGLAAAKEETIDDAAALE